MSHTKQPTLELAAFAATLKKHPRRWIVPAAAIALLAVAYTIVRTPKWEASQALLVRDEAVGNLHRPGRFDSVDSMKTAQETVMELAKSRNVVEAALRQVSQSHSTAPTDAEVAKVQDAIQVMAPKGAEFGRTEVFYLKVRDADAQRAVALTQAVSEQLDQRLRELRNSKAQSLIDELNNTVKLARTDLDESTQRLSQLEQQVGSDLAELRILNEMSSGESNLRQNLIEIKKELGAARVTQRVNQQLLEMLQAGRDNPKSLIGVPSELMKSQPALHQIKNGLVAIRLRTAELLGVHTPAHPRVQAAVATEKEICRHLQSELTRSIVALKADLELGNTRIESLAGQQSDIQDRMQQLAGMRAGYGNLVKEVQKRTDIMSESQARLSDARASQSAAQSASLITMLDGPTTPGSPVGPSNSMIIAVGVFGGLLAGFGLVLLTVPVVKPVSEPMAAESERVEEKIAADPRPVPVLPKGRGLNLREALSRIEQFTPSAN